MYLLLYVDDTLIASHDKSLIDKLKAQLSHEVDMKDLGSAKKILGMEIQRDRHAGTLFLRKVILRKFLKSIISVIANLLLHHLLHILNCHQGNVLLLKMRKSTWLTYRILMLLGISCML
jgi:creatinine amidohydrolase/Fe(II)-dependent formamide hydrolase-like protein